MHLTAKPQNYMKQKLTEIKGKRDNSAIIAGDFSTSLSMIYWIENQAVDQQRNGRLEQHCPPATPDRSICRVYQR